MLHLGEDLAGKPASASVGERVEVVLPEAGGTGYRWRLSDACPALLAMESDELRPDTARPGAAGQRHWVFVAKAAGDCELRFESLRSWEASPAGKAVRFPLTVLRKP